MIGALNREDRPGPGRAGDNGGTRIRLATVNDVDGVGEVERSVGFQSLGLSSARYPMWVAVVDDRIVGFLEASFDSDFAGRCVVPDGVDLPHGYLSLIAVLPSHRRTGLAAALLRAYCIAAEDRGVTFVVANPSTTDEGLTARTGFFARYGLVEVGIGRYHFLIGATVRAVLDGLAVDGQDGAQT